MDNYQYNNPGSFQNFDSIITEPKICIIGAGFSGICIAIKLKSRLGLKNFQIFDQNEDFGGTWLVNRYPGCRCDFQSHLYSYSFEPNPNWSVNFAERDEIFEYLKKVVEKHGLYDEARFGVEIKSSVWIEEKGQWLVTLFDKKTGEIESHFFDFVITAIGPLSVPKIPVIFDNFTGIKMHSAEWIEGIDLKNKKVGIVGNGASGIQLIPSVADLGISELHSYQRDGAWVIPKFDLKFPEFIKKLFAFFPFFMKIYRLSLFLLYEILHLFLAPGTVRHSFAQKFCLFFLKRQIPGENDLNNDLRMKLSPKYKLGCKQILVSSNYFPTFLKPNVHLHSGEITKVQTNQITSQDGTSTELDVLILATGFRIQDYFFNLKFVGRDGLDLYKEFKSTGPKVYRGIMVHKFPNAFTILGFNSGLSHNSIIFIIECECDSIVEIIGEMMKKRLKVVEVRSSAQEKWMTQLELDMSKTIWGLEKCGSYYTNTNGVVTVLWPKNCISFLWKTKWPKFDDMEFTK